MMPATDPEFAKAACGCSFTKRGLVLDQCDEVKRLIRNRVSGSMKFPHLDHYANARESVGMAREVKW